MQRRWRYLVCVAAADKMKFCPNCNFILYPKEDKDDRKLIYYCRSQRCDHEEDAPDPYVFRNQVIKTRTVNLDHVLSAVANDPTLQRSTVDCPKCHHHEAVLIQSTQNVKSNKLTLIFVCCNPNCGNKWTDDDAR